MAARSLEDSLQLLENGVGDLWLAQGSISLFIMGVGVEVSLIPWCYSFPEFMSRQHKKGHFLALKEASRNQL